MRRVSILSGIPLLLLATSSAVPVYGSASAMSARGNDKVAVHLVNENDQAQTIKVDGHIYPVQAHASVDVKVPVGSVVYAAGKNATHQDGDKLMTITPEMKDQKVYFNCADCTATGFSLVPAQPHN